MNIADHLPLNEREEFLKNNAEAPEELLYAKMFSEEELALMKDSLAAVDMEIDFVEEEKKAVTAEYTASIKLSKKERKGLLRNIRTKSVEVNEVCYKFLDEEARSVKYYNKIGDMVFTRPMKPEEYQRSIFPLLKDTGVKPAKPE